MDAEYGSNDHFLPRSRQMNVYRSWVGVVSGVNQNITSACITIENCIFNIHNTMMICYLCPGKVRPSCDFCANAIPLERQTYGHVAMTY